tara:strand:+ start:287 stop:544 length:258 start_codon:yes stop_codon:yes gene_type:complete
MAFKMKGWNAGKNTGSAYSKASAAFQKEKSPVDRYNELKNKKNKTREEVKELESLMEKLDRMYDDQYEDERDLYNQLNPNNPERD